MSRWYYLTFKKKLEVEMNCLYSYSILSAGCQILSDEIEIVSLG